MCVSWFVLFLPIRHAAGSTLFPYTTLFRSVRGLALRDEALRAHPDAGQRRDGHDCDRVPFLQRAHDSLIQDRKSTRLNSSHITISYAVFCLKKKNNAESRTDIDS